MSNTGAITIRVYCDWCQRYIENDSDIVLSHITDCMMKSGRMTSLPEVYILQNVRVYTRRNG